MERKIEMKVKRDEEIEKLSNTKTIKNIVKETTQKSRRLLKNRRPAAIRDRQMTREEVAAITAKETSDVKNLRKAMKGAPDV